MEDITPLPVVGQNGRTQDACCRVFFSASAQRLIRREGVRWETPQGGRSGSKEPHALHDLYALGLRSRPYSVHFRGEPSEGRSAGTSSWEQVAQHNGMKRRAKGRLFTGGRRGVTLLRGRVALLFTRRIWAWCAVFLHGVV